MVTRHRMTPDERTAARTRAALDYQAGHTVRAIADKMGRSYGWCWRALQAEEVAMRPRGGKR